MALHLMAFKTILVANRNVFVIAAARSTALNARVQITRAPEAGHAQGRPHSQSSACTCRPASCSEDPGAAEGNLKGKRADFAAN